MRSRWSAVVLVSIGFLLAVLFALLSVEVQRIGPELVQYGNLCGSSANEPCYQPALKGGFPFAFLIDAPGISRERQLAFFEDTLHPVDLILDIGVYFIAILALAVPVSRHWSVHRRGTDRANA